MAAAAARSVSGWLPAGSTTTVVAAALAGAAVGAAVTAAVLRAGRSSHRKRLDGSTVEEGAVRAIFANAKRGDPVSVLAAFDAYCWAQHWMMNVGDVKGGIVRAALAGLPPGALVLEFGGYCGYSAVLLGSLLPPGGKLVSIEINPVVAALATKVVEYAGLADRVTVMVSDVPAALDTLRAERGPGAVDAVFIDHAKELYLRDLKNLEARDLLHVGSIIVGDNILFPGAPDYLAYVQSSPRYATVTHDTKLEYSSDARDMVAVTTVRALSP